MYFSCQNPKYQEVLSFNKQLLPSLGANFRCPKCNNVFSLKPETAKTADNQPENNNTNIEKKCPNCNQLLTLSDDKIPLLEANFRCPSCQTVFFISPPPPNNNLQTNQNIKNNDKLNYNCTSCKEIISINKKQIPSQGANFRCPKCSNVFFLKPETAKTKETAKTRKT